MGVTKTIPPFHYFPNFSTSPKYTLAIEYHVHIWQVSRQLSCGDTCQIWIGFKNITDTFTRSKILLMEKLTDRTIVTPTPGQHGGHSPILVPIREVPGHQETSCWLQCVNYPKTTSYLLHSTAVVNKPVGHRGSFDCFFVVGSHRDQSCHLWMQVFAPLTLHNGLTLIVRYEQLLLRDWFRDRQGIIWQEWILCQFWCFLWQTGLDVKIWPPWSW